MRHMHHMQKSARLFATIQSKLHMKVAYGIANRVECPYAALFCRIVAHTSKTHIIMADSDFEHDSDSTTQSDNEEGEVIIDEVVRYFLRQRTEQHERAEAREIRLLVLDR
jgi:hypothetical protein